MRTKYHKPAIAKMGHYELDLLIKYFTTRLVGEDKRLLNDFFELPGVSHDILKEPKNSQKISQFEHAKKALDALSSLERSYNHDVWTIEKKRAFIDTWIECYIPKNAWERYLNSARVAKHKYRITPVRPLKVDLSDSYTAEREEALLKAVAQEMGGIDLNTTQLRGILLSLGMTVLEKSLQHGVFKTHLAYYCDVKNIDFTEEVTRARLGLHLHSQDNQLLTEHKKKKK